MSTDARLSHPPRMVFQNAELVSKDGGMTYVGLSLPCKGKYDYELTHQELVCEHNAPHGHVIIYCLDEACIMPAAIESQPMLGSVLATLVQQTHLNKDEMQDMLSHPAAHKLAKQLTEREKEILKNREAFTAFCDLGGFYRF